MQAGCFSDWQRWFAEGARWLPAMAVWRDAVLPSTWDAFTDGTATALLESGGTGRHTFACCRPERLVFGWGQRVEVWSGDGATCLRTVAGAPLDVLPCLLQERRAPVLAGWPAMTGGFLGVFGYDLVRTWEKLPARAVRDVPLPLCALVEPRELFVYDGRTRELGVIVWSAVGPDTAVTESAFLAAQAAATAAIDQWQTAIGREAGALARSHRTHTPMCSASFSAEGFIGAVRRVLGYIAAGDTYQVNLSVRESRATDASDAQIYAALRAINPSPYMGLLRLPGWSLVCGSPELLVRVVGGKISSRPIAGTRPRGEGPVRDRELSAELLANEKERAEHLMLIDLIRSDIGRVARFGSVQVTEFMGLEHYSHVMHIVSQVEGRLADGCGWADALRAMFPGGTITGCPKYRTMEIIEELEPVGRGFYTGALGWISYAGEMELNIVIRSMLVREGVAQVAAGAGIVADSNPERELDEARRKARALWVALDQAERLHDRK